MEPQTIEPPIESVPGRASVLRTFLPFWITLSVGLAIMAWDYHRRNAPLTKFFGTLSIDGRPYAGGFAFEVDGRPQRLDQPVTIGKRHVRISASDTEPESLEYFVWYGPNNLGVVDLHRSHGSLAVHGRPQPERMELHGQFANLTNATGEFRSVPASDYELTAIYGEQVERRPLHVIGNQTTRIDLSAKIGSLELESDPADGNFELTARNGGAARRGTLPARFAFLPAGDYRLVVRRDSYVREDSLTVKAGETNRVLTKFNYATIELLSTPAGANVFSDGKTLGSTPYKQGGLIPGKYRFEVRKDGFDPQTVEVPAEGDQVSRATVTLVDTRYRKALDQARLNLESRNFAAAVRDLEEALQIQPGDQVASDLLPRARAAALRVEASELASRDNFDAAFAALDRAEKEVPNDAATLKVRDAVTARKTEADKRLGQVAEQRRQEELAARRRKAAEMFDQSLAGETDLASFPTVLRHTSKSLVDFRAACAKFGAANSGLKPVEKQPTDTQQVSFKFGSLVPLLGFGNYLRLHAAEIGPGETDVRMKLFTYGPGDGRPAPTPNPALLQSIQNSLRVLLDGDLK